MPSTPTTPPMTDVATGLTSDDVRRAALTVCSYSADAAEARDLLEALGLLDVVRETSLAS
ncbi:MAG: hypothetical protein ACLGIG_13070 [Actinomycetes bacterium]